MKNIAEPEWRIETRFKEKLGAEDSKFILDEAEKAFNDTIETSARILERSSSLLQLISGILVGLVAYAIGKWEKSAFFDGLLITALLGMAYYLCLGLFLIFPNIKPSVYVLPGSQPKKLFNDAIFNSPDNNRAVLFNIIKITNLQQGITNNRAINNKRWDYYKMSLNFLFYSPVFLIMVYLLMNSISRQS